MNGSEDIPGISTNDPGPVGFVAGPFEDVDEDATGVAVVDIEFAEGTTRSLLLLPL